MRGYFGIGIYNGKTKENVGTLWRAAYLYGASFIFTIGKRFPRQATDTPKTELQVPMYEHNTWEDFVQNMPKNCFIACIEQNAKSRKLNDIKHPERVAYVLGAEDRGLPEKIMEGNMVIEIPTLRVQSMNVAMAGSIVMYDRYIKGL